MLDHAAPEPAQGAGTGGDKPLADAGRAAACGAPPVRARAVSAAAFRALTERLKASAKPRPAQHVLGGQERPPPSLSFDFGVRAEAPQPEPPPASACEPQPAPEPPLAPDEPSPPPPAETDETQALLDVLADALADPAGEAPEAPLSALDGELAQVIEEFLGRRTEPDPSCQQKLASHEEEPANSAQAAASSEETAAVEPPVAPDLMPAFAGTTDEEVDESSEVAGSNLSSEGVEASDGVDAASATEQGPGSRQSEPRPEAAARGPATAWQDAPAQELDAGGAETARILLDIMSMPSGASQPQERALAADTLLRIVDRMPPAGLVLLSERLSLMEAPPPLLVRRLLASPSAEVAAPLLERCNTIPDQDLIELCASVDTARLRMIARRRRVSSALVDVLIRRRDASLDLTLIRNPNAVLSHEAFSELGERAKTETSLQAPLATRADTPAPIAFELFWHLPAELRRYVLSRFLTDSSTLERILAIARNIGHGGEEEAGPGGFPERRRLDELAGLVEDGDDGRASRLLSGLAGICEASARRIISDPGGEPLMVAMKALGMPRAQFAEAIERWRRSPAAALKADRDTSDLQALFDSLSFNKARVLLTYWDWAALRSGPYQRQDAA